MAVFTSWSLLLACVGAPSSPEPWIEIGGGETRWQPLAEGADHEMVHGPQGGWHMLGSVRAVGFEEVLRVRFQITVPDRDDAMVSDNLYAVQALVDPMTPSILTYPGMYGYLEVGVLAEGELDTPPELLSGLPVVLWMEVTDDRGRQAEDSVEVTAAPDPDDLDMVPGAPGG